MPQGNPAGYLPEQTPEEIIPTRDMAMALLQERGAPLTNYNLNGAMQILTTNPEILKRISMAQATTNRRAPVDAQALAPPAAGAGDGRFDLAERAAMGKPQAGANVSEVPENDAQGETEGQSLSPDRQYIEQQRASSGGFDLPATMYAVPAALAFALAKRRGLNVPTPNIGAVERAAVPRARAAGNAVTAGASPTPMPATGAQTRAAAGDASASSFTGGLDGEMPSPPRSRTSVRVNGKSQPDAEAAINAASTPPTPTRKPSMIPDSAVTGETRPIPNNPSIQAAERQAQTTGVVKAGTRIDVPGTGTVTISRDMPQAEFEKLKQAYQDDIEYFKAYGRKYTQPLSEKENPNSSKNVKGRIDRNKGD